MIIVYFKADCSKCTTTSCLLEEENIAFQKIEYLNTPPSKVELISLIQKLGIPANSRIRKNELYYTEKYLGKDLSEDQSIEALIADPVLMERPIVVDGEKAIICRSPEKLFEF